MQPSINEEVNRRRAWFDDYFERSLQGGDADLPKRYFCCPCCGYPTLPERGGHDICELCNWEDDGQDDPQADEVRGGPNGSYSLAQARENFHTYGVMYSPENDMRLIGGDTDAEWAAKQGLIRAFETMRSGTGDALGSLQAEIASCRRILQAEMIKKVRGFARITD